MEKYFVLFLCINVASPIVAMDSRSSLTPLYSLAEEIIKLSTTTHDEKIKQRVQSLWMPDVSRIKYDVLKTINLHFEALIKNLMLAQSIDAYPKTQYEVNAILKTLQREEYNPLLEGKEYLKAYENVVKSLIELKTEVLGSDEGDQFARHMAHKISF